MDYILDNFIKPRFRQANDIWGHHGFQKYLKNTGWMFLGRFISLFVSFLTTIYIVRNLGPENYGSLSYAISFVAIFAFISSLGTDQVLYRDLIKYPDKINEYLGSAFFIKIVAGSIAVLITTITTFIITPNELLLNLAVIIIAFSFIFQPFHLIKYFFHSKVNSKIPIIVTTTVGIIINILKIIVIMMNEGVLYLSIILLLESIFVAILMILIYQREENILNWSFKKNVAKKILIDSWPFIFFGAFATIYSRVDQIMIQNMIDTTSVGLYDAAVRLTEVWYVIPAILLSSLFPAVINAQKNGDQYFKRIKILAFLMTIFSIGISFAIFIQSKLITYIIYGEQFLETAGVLNIYIWSLFGTFMGYGAIHYLLAENKKKTMFFMSFITMIINIILNIILIPMYGIMGAAWATVISYTISPFIPILFHKIR